MYCIAYYSQQHWEEPVLIGLVKKRNDEETAAGDAAQKWVDG